MSLQQNETMILLFLYKIRSKLRNLECSYLFWAFTGVFFTRYGWGFYFLFFDKYPTEDSITLLLKPIKLNVLKEKIFFFSESLLLGFIQSNINIFIFYLIFIVAILFISKNIKWDILLDRKWRIFLVLVAFIITWNNAFSHFNYFTNQWYAFDRILLIFFTLLIYFTPKAFLAYFPIIFLFYSSFHFPIGGYSGADKILPIAILLYTLLIYVLFCCSKNILARNFNFKKSWFAGILIIVSSSYFAPFLSKIQISPNLIDWFLWEDISLIFEKRLDRGWLVNLPSIYIDYLRHTLIKYHELFQFIAFVIEGTSLFLISNSKKIRILILSSFILFHLGIFFFLACFFWKWVFFDLLLIIFYLYDDQKFYYNHLTIITTMVIFFSWISPIFPKLAWYDNPYSENFHLEATDINNNVIPINNADMAPFDMFFSLHGWDIFKGKAMPETSKNAQENNYLKNLSPNQLLSQSDSNAHIHYNEQNKYILTLFLKEYFTNYNHNPTKSFLTPIPHIPVNKSESFPFDKKIKAIEVILEPIWYPVKSNKVKKIIKNGKILIPNYL